MPSPSSTGDRCGSGSKCSMPEPAWAAAPVAIATLYFAVISVVLTAIDVRSHRLPNSIVLPAYPVTLGLLALACALGADGGDLLRAVVGMIGLGLFYLLLRLLSRQGMGGGDVKLAGVVGLYLGWFGWGPLVVGAVAAFLMGGVVAAVLLITRRADRRTAVPFGPYMLAGAWIGIIIGDRVSGLLGIGL